MLCHCCKKNRATRGNLCRICYSNGAIRGRYAPEKRKTKLPRPAEELPTANPLAELQRRAERGEPLFKEKREDVSE